MASNQQSQRQRRRRRLPVANATTEGVLPVMTGSAVQYVEDGELDGLPPRAQTRGWGDMGWQHG